MNNYNLEKRGLRLGLLGPGALICMGVKQISPNILKIVDCTLERNSTSLY